MMWKFANENPWAFVATCALAAVALQVVCRMLVNLAGVVGFSRADEREPKPAAADAEPPPKPPEVARNERGRPLN